jgi:hypothetical protein
VVPIGRTSLGALGEHERRHAYCRRCRRYRSLDVLALLDRHRRPPPPDGSTAAPVPPLRGA